MKKLYSVLLTMLISLSAFANWQTGSIVDEFGDPTGNYFIYTTSEGSFSNSATTNSPAFLRVVVTLEEDYLVPVPLVILEPHCYNWDNPTDNPADNRARLSFKADSRSYNKDTLDNKTTPEVPWNYLENSAGYVIYEMLYDNDVIKCAIQTKFEKYSFVIDCSGFAEAFYNLVLKTNKTAETKKWFDIDKYTKVMYVDVEEISKNTTFYTGFFEIKAKCLTDTTTITFTSFSRGNNGVYHKYSSKNFDFKKVSFLSGKKSYKVENISNNSIYLSQTNKVIDEKKLMNIVNNSDSFTLEILRNDIRYQFNLSSEVFKQCVPKVFL